MRALQWFAQADVRFVDVERPGVVTSRDVILEVEACGICGSDVEEVTEGPIVIPTEPHLLTGVRAPVTLGHEIVGTVVEAGDDVALPLGARVAPTPVISCGTCPRCKEGDIALCPSIAVVGLSAHGGFADYVRVDATQCVVVSRALTPAVAALVEPLAVAIRAVEGQMIQGVEIGIVGYGSVGACLLAVAYGAGATSVTVIDPDPAARNRATRAGAVRALAPTEAEELELSLVVEASGALKGVATAVAAAGQRATVVLVGLRGGDVPLPSKATVYGELELVGRVGHGLPHMRAAAHGLRQGTFEGRLPEPRIVGFEGALRSLYGRDDSRGEKTVLVPARDTATAP